MCCRLKRVASPIFPLVVAELERQCPAVAGRVVRALPARGARQRDPVPAAQAALLLDPARAEREMDHRPEARRGVAVESVALVLARLRHLRNLQRQSLQVFGRSPEGDGGTGITTAPAHATGGDRKSVV